MEELTVSPVLSITVCQVIQARNLGVILHSSLYLPFPVCQQALCILSPQYMDSSTSLSITTTLFQILLYSPLTYCSSPLTGVPTSTLEFLQTGWEEGSKNDLVLLTIRKRLTPQ